MSKVIHLRSYCGSARLRRASLCATSAGSVAPQRVVGIPESADSCCTGSHEAGATLVSR